MRSTFTVLLIWFACFVHADEIDVVLLSGQSNMVGSGRVAELPATDRAKIWPAVVWNGVEFKALQAGATPKPHSQNFGPEIGFAKKLAKVEPERSLYMIKFALGGQPLHHGWDGGKWVGNRPAKGRATFYPGESPDDENIGRHYQALMKVVEPAFEHLRSRGDEPRLRAVIWMQGEADSKNKQSAQEYDQSLRLLKKRIEQDLNSPSVPFVFGQVLPHAPPLARFTHRDLIRERQRLADMRADSNSAIPGVWMVPTENMPLHKDTVHYNTQGQLMLGAAFADGLIAAEAAMDALE